MDGMNTRDEVFVIGATNRPNSIDSALRRPGRFEREIRIDPPNEETRAKILQSIMRNCTVEASLDFNEIAKLTNGYVGADLESLFREANYLAMQRNFQDQIYSVIKDDFINSMQKLGKPSLLRSNTVIIENANWDQIGGLDSVKSQLKRLIEWPLLYKDSYKRLGLKPPKGILLYGPPGCSKTSLVKV